MLSVCLVLPAGARADSMEDLAEDLSDLSGRLSKKTVAVLPFDVDARIDPAYGNYIAERLTHELVNEGKFAVVERSRVDRVFTEQRLSATGAVSPETTCASASCSVSRPS